MGLEIVPCTIDDWQELTAIMLMGESDLMRGDQSDIQDRFMPDSHSLLLNGKIIACGGITAHWAAEAPNQVGTAWLRMVDSSIWGNLRLVIAYRVRRRLFQTIAERPYQMVEANVNRLDLRAQRLVTWMGFRACGFRDGFGPKGEDMILFQWRRSYHVRV